MSTNTNDIPQGDPRVLIIEFEGDPLAYCGLSYADIIDVSFNLKRDTRTDSDAAYMQKVSPDGVTWNADTHIFTVSLVPEDTQEVSTGLYEGVLAIKVADFTKRIELDIEKPQIKIINDKNRD